MNPEIHLLAEIDATQNEINDLQERAFKAKLRLRELKQEHTLLKDRGKRRPKPKPTPQPVKWVAVFPVKN